jgi:hypothetical protein
LPEPRLARQPLRLALLDVKAVRRGLMFPGQVSVQDAENARAAVILVIASIMIFRRFVLQLMLAIIVVATGLGLLVLLQAIHR